MMTQSNLQDAVHTGGADESSASPYRSVSLGAVFGLVLGAVSALALVSPAMWMVAAAGVLVNVLAIRAMSTADTLLAGRWMAYLGLFLSLAFGVAGPVDIWAGRWLLEKSARPIAEAWFSALQHGEPEKAQQLRVTAGSRLPADKDLAEYFRTTAKAHQDLEHFVADPVVKTLLLLGEKAQVRWYAAGEMTTEEGHNSVSPIYAVTFDDHGTKTTFFVALTLERTADFSGQALARDHAPKGA